MSDRLILTAETLNTIPSSDRLRMDLRVGDTVFVEERDGRLCVTGVDLALRPEGAEPGCFSAGRIAITIPHFLDRLEKAEVKLRLSAELMEFVNDGQLGSLDGVCLNLAEASDLVTALVKELHTLPEKEMMRRWSCAPHWEVAIVPGIDAVRQPSEEVCHA